MRRVLVVGGLVVLMGGGLWVYRLVTATRATHSDTGVIVRALLLDATQEHHARFESMMEALNAQTPAQVAYDDLEQLVVMEEQVHSMLGHIDAYEIESLDHIATLHTQIAAQIGVRSEALRQEFRALRERQETQTQRMAAALRDTVEMRGALYMFLRETFGQYRVTSEGVLFQTQEGADTYNAISTQLRALHQKTVEWYATSSTAQPRTKTPMQEWIQQQVSHEIMVAP